MKTLTYFMNMIKASYCKCYEIATNKNTGDSS